MPESIYTGKPFLASMEHYQKGIQFLEEQRKSVRKIQDEMTENIRKGRSSAVDDGLQKIYQIPTQHAVTRFGTLRVVPETAWKKAERLQNLHATGKVPIEKVNEFFQDIIDHIHYQQHELARWHILEHGKEPETHLEIPKSIVTWARRRRTQLQAYALAYKMSDIWAKSGVRPLDFLKRINPELEGTEKALSDKERTVLEKEVMDPNRFRSLLQHDIGIHDREAAIIQRWFDQDPSAEKLEKSANESAKRLARTIVSRWNRLHGRK